MRDEEIILIKKIEVTDEYGNNTHQEQRATVLGDLLSIGTNEFYEAAAKGFKPEKKFKLTELTDYDGQEQLEHDGIIYDIIRTYASGRELELTCQRGL